MDNMLAKQEDFMEIQNNNSFCSFQVQSMEDKKQLFKVISSPDHSTSEFIGKQIKVKDLYVEEVEMPNQETGELQLCHRVVLIDDKGIAYQSVSSGIWSAVCRMVQVFGTPTYDEPLTIEIYEIVKAANRRILTFKVV